MKVGEVKVWSLFVRVGYPYRISVAKHGQKTREGHSDVQIPPTVSSLTDELQQYDLAHGDGQASQLLKEVSAAKKSATLPLPKATAPSIAPETKKEYKDQHARVRDQYYKDAVSGGPQSRVLDGITWNEAQKLRETAESQGQHGPAVTAASKAIIQREKQGDAVIYKGHTERNPFDKVSDQELHDYVDQVSGRKPPQSPQAAVQVDVRTLPNDAGQSAVASPSSPGAVAPQAQVTAQPQPASPEKQQGTFSLLSSIPSYYYSSLCFDVSALTQDDCATLTVMSYLFSMRFVFYFSRSIFFEKFTRLCRSRFLPPNCFRKKFTEQV